MIKTKIITDNINNIYIFKCPNCFDYIQVLQTELNCRIFRHAYYKKTLEQVNPHLSKDECDKLIKEDEIYGCCKPFKIINEGENLYAEICDYI
jgi:hypothetical protein